MQHPSSLLSKELHLTHRLCEMIGSSRALTVSLLVSAGEWDQLVALECDPGHYFNQTVSDFAGDYLVTEVLKKSQVLPLRLDLEAKAKADFLSAERRCALTNARLFGTVKPSWFHDFSFHVRKIMGHLTPSVLNRICERGRFGPGVSTGVNAKELVASKKYKCKDLHLTHSLVPFVRPLMGEAWWNFHRHSFIVVKGNRYFTVPKKATARRGACSEPDLNIRVQLGIGDHLVDRLRIFGVDIRDQGVNRSLVKRAHSSRIATIDLSQASDCMARAAVLESVSGEWAHLLEIARSPFTFIDGTWVELEKFSSMGNGFTFPLETILFSAVLRASVPIQHWQDCSVYGDDILCPQEYAALVVDRLEFLGFQVNRTKTHLAGEFFESCGLDAFRGVNVRPFYCRQEPSDPVPFEVRMANALRVYASQMTEPYCDERWKPLWDELVANTPRTWRVKVPYHFGDVGIITSESECDSPLAWNRREYAGWEGRLVRFVQMRPVKKFTKSYGVLLAKLSALELGGPGEAPTYGLEPIRGALRSCVRGSTVTEWPLGLDWV